MKKYKHIFFDLDQTLWDFKTNSRRILEQLYTKYELFNHFNSFDEYYDIYHFHNDILWEEYRKGSLKKSELRWTRFYIPIFEKGYDNKQVAKKMGEEYVEESPKQNTLFPFAIEVLEYLHKKYKLYVITNGFKEVQDVKMKVCNLEKYFERVFTSEEIGAMKPKREAFEFSLNSVNAKKSESIMIGDDINSDIRGAKNYGIDQVLFNPALLKHDESPTFEINSLKELIGIF
ncbi:MAG: noncanonical pyrimidine nucleotidase, YjjG family [Bacteroidetes bacterium GWF2_33_38]|nr:MAG: noncanonical pyrimidine nucleotidase, YjjG family [Bacteroidetes bacterium GWF2_33_38]HBX51665.1 noncanonical pyrimidine nucleotidase, YjjG family [Bacteroidales bacterium]